MKYSLENFLLWRNRCNLICREILKTSPDFFNDVASYLVSQNLEQYKGLPIETMYHHCKEFYSYSNYLSHLEELLNSNGIIIDHSNKSTE